MLNSRKQGDEMKRVSKLKVFKRVAIFFIMGSILSVGLEGYAANNKDASPIKNVILISVDTLRADHLSCYGYARQTSPHIDELANKGVLFYNNITQATASLPAYASIFTSRYSSQHKAVADHISHPKISNVILLSESEITLAEILKKNGYITAAFTDGAETAKIFNIDQGFDIYNDDAGGIKNINQRVFSWMEENQNNKFFLFVQAYDPHSPYEPPGHFRSLFQSDKQKELEKNAVFTDKDNIDEDFDGEIDEDMELTEDMIYNFVALYDGEIAYTDKHIGELFRKIDELGLRDSTLIIFTSDHGEEFKEHSGLRHGQTVYDEVIHVPLIFANEKLFSQKRINNQVRSIDIAPTILEILNIPIPEVMMGKSLVGLMNGESESERLAISESEARDKLSCRSLTYKLILTHDTSQLEIFNLQNDPGEKKDIHAHNDELSIYKKCLVKISQWKKLAEDSALVSRVHNMEYDDKLKKQLQELGYW